VHEFGVPFESACLALPLGLTGGILWFIGFLFTIQAPRDHRRRNVRWLVTPAVLALLALVLAKAAFVPKAFFALNQSEFDAEVKRLTSEGLPPVSSGEWEELPLDRRIGGFRVDVLGVDSAGGLWFRTGTYSDMIDRGSVGFYYRSPNTATPLNTYGAPTSPFGAAGLDLRNLGGGWYYFDVTDDWF
jgi:hypothetical protein